MNAKSVQTMIAEALKGIGFQGSGGSYMVAVGTGVAGFLGVTCTKQHDGVVSAWIVIGIRHEAINARGAVLGCYADSNAQPSIAVAMKYLRSDESCGEYHFTGSKDSDQSEIERLLRDVSELAAAFYAEFSTIDKALTAISETRIRGLQNIEVFAPLAMLVKGRTADAVSMARTTLAGMDTRRGTGKQYATFVERLVANASH